MPLNSFLQDRHALGPLTIEINLVKDTKSFLEIKDNGVGIHPKILMDSMTTFGSSTMLKFKSDYNLAEHGMGLKLNCLRLG
jgi:HSP90 family molecular chaperone